MHLSVTTRPKGFTLIELIVSVGLFSVVMLLTSGSYLVMMSLNKQAHSISTGIDNLSFALETMARTIRTGTGYTCPVASQSSCFFDATDLSPFSFTDSEGDSFSYYRDPNFGSIMQHKVHTDIDPAKSSDTTYPLTDKSSVTITLLTFYAFGVKPYSVASTDTQEAGVLVVIQGYVPNGHGGNQPFTVQTAASMRGVDL